MEKPQQKAAVSIESLNLSQTQPDVDTRDTEQNEMLGIFTTVYIWNN